MNLTIVLINYPHTDNYAAQCIEYDIAAQGATPEKAMGELWMLISRYVNEREGGLEGLPQAPPFYQAQFNGAPTRSSMEYAEVSVGL